MGSRVILYVEDTPLLYPLLGPSDKQATRINGLKKRGTGLKNAKAASSK